MSERREVLMEALCIALQAAPAAERGALAAAIEDYAEAYSGSWRLLKKSRFVDELLHALVEGSDARPLQD